MSFCSHGEGHEYEQNNGLLSQWRGYGPDGGYALVFETKELMDLLEKETTKFWFSESMIGDVVYEDDDDAFQNEFCDLIKLLSQNVKKAVGGKDWSPGEMYFPFVSGVSRYKHRGFYEEREVRLVAAPWTKRMLDATKKQAPDFDETERMTKNILYRQGMIPYIELFIDNSALLPIKKIIVGPHRQKDERADRISRMVAKQEIEVVCSETPFISF